MELFFSQKIPPFDRVVLVESGPRRLFDSLAGDLYKIHGEDIRVDLVTCFSGLPEGFRETNGQVYRVRDYPGWEGAKRLAAALRANQPTVLGIICAGVPVMSKWKWMLAATLPAKLFVLNENGDYFWVDYSQWRTIVHFFAFRAGLSGANSVLLPLRMLAYPFGMSLLAGYALWMHGRRWLRLRFGG